LNKPSNIGLDKIGGALQELSEVFQQTMVLRNFDKQAGGLAEAWERKVHTELREAPRRMNTILTLEAGLAHPRFVSVFGFHP
jgi:hypothetical protein